MIAGATLRSCLAALSMMFTSAALGHPGHHKDAPTHNAHAPAQPYVKIFEDELYRHIESNGLPDHETGNFPNRNNPNTIRQQSYSFRMPLSPRANERAIESRHFLFGVALNGVVFDPGTAEFWNNDRNWRYDAKSGKIDLGLDDSNAHVQPSGAYHYHGIPTALLKQLSRENEKMILIGYAADGFPIYGPMAHEKADDPKSKLRRMASSYRVKTGERAGGPGGKYDGTFVQDWEFVEGAGDLDECNGRFGVTPEFPKGTYYYLLTEEYPFVPRMFRGTPDSSFEVHRPDNRPPPPRHRRP